MLFSEEKRLRRESIDIKTSPEVNDPNRQPRKEIWKITDDVKSESEEIEMVSRETPRETEAELGNKRRKSNSSRAHDVIAKKDITKEQVSVESGTELMSRLFPGVKRSTLHAIVHECKGDVTLSVEQLLAGQKDAHALSSIHPAARYFLQSGTSHLLQSLYSLPNSPYASMTGFKTPPLVSPLHQMHHPALRHPYPSSSRTFPLGIPYPQQLFPGFGFNYSPAMSVAGMPGFMQHKQSAMAVECGAQLPRAPASADNQ